MLSNMSKIRSVNINNVFQKYVNSAKPIFFDVSLRDGIQGMPKIRQENFSLNDKINIFHNIIFNYKPEKIEIGSIVNPKILPIMADSLKLYEYAINYIKKTKDYNPNIYLVAPNKKAILIGLENGVSNFSLLTSISNSFQKMNVNKSIYETRKEFTEIFKLVENSEPEINTKLYISCINDCPLEGKIDNDLIIREIMTYHKMFPGFQEYCLSDTCGSLKFEDYKYILDSCIFFGLPPSKISLHLHINKNNIEEISQIIYHSLDNSVIRFDVSILETGGCSVTMPTSNLLPNLSYELLNSVRSKYLKIKSDD